MFFRSILLISLFAIASPSQADTVDIGLRDTSVRLQYSASMGQDTLGKSELYVGALYTDNDNFMGDAGLLVQDEISSNLPIINIGFGIKALAGRAQANDVAAIAVGALVGVKPFPDPRLSFVGELYVSPKILSFSDATRYIDSTARVEFEIIPQAVAYVGYRSTMFDLKNNSSAKIDDGPHIGMRMMF